MVKRALLLLLVSLAHASPCLNYLAKLLEMSLEDPDRFKAEMTPFLILSGKGVDDLGFQQLCQDDKRNYSYNTVEVSLRPNTTSQQYKGYLGFCFTSMCDTHELDKSAGFLINYIFDEYDIDVKASFISSPIGLEFHPAALIMALGFLACIGVAMSAPIMVWVRMCMRSEDEEFIIKSVYIDLENPNEEYDDDTIHETSTLLERLSLKYKWKELWKEEETQKIYSFSLFRVLALPLALYGQIFWLTNSGAFNYYAFWEEIYDEFFVKFAVFAYYIPDIFFFISSFLFAQKILLSQEEDLNLFKTLGKRLARLYPLYIVVFLIYWCISPALHAGPVWYKYQEQAAVCNSSWWRVLLMIDNWFSEGCYPALWFVQVEAQYAVLISLLFVLYLKARQAFYYVFGALYIGTFAILFALSAELPSSFSVALQDYTQLYFRSFYSHIWFSFAGVLFALLANKESIRLSVQDKILDRPLVFGLLHTFGVGIAILILLRPWLWLGKVPSQIQLALCREGIMLSFIIFFLRGMFQREKHRSVLHKYGYYMYPVYLVVWMVVCSQYWSGGSFPYVSGGNILNMSVGSLLISGALGVFLGLLFDLRTLTIK